MFDEYRFSGSLPEEATTYVTREADGELYEGLTAGKFCYVLNSRQSGKSSLRVRTMRRLRDLGVECAAIDLSAGGIQNVPPEQWYADLIDTLIDSFGLDVDFGDWWGQNQLNSLVTRFRKFLEEILLVEIQENIVIFIDEIDSVLSLNFPTDDFFAFIRSCYNQRVDNPNYNRLTFCLLGVASPSNLIEDKKRTPFNIGKAISIKGFQLHEVEPLEKGLQKRYPDSHRVMKDILHWTGGQPFLTQKLCQFMVEESFQDNPRNVEQVVRSRIIENWESQDEPEHLRTIRDRILRDEQRAGYLLELYQQIRHSEEQAEVIADDTLEQSELQLSGLVVRQQNKLKVYNPIYREIFDRDWIETQLRNLRPYSENFRFWVASDGKDESRLLRGKALHDALLWASDKSLNYQDREFLAASQAKEKEEAIAALEKEAQLERERKDKEAVEKRNLVLSEANQKARQRIRIGGVVLAITLSVAGTLGVLAYAFAKQLTRTQQYLKNVGTLTQLAGKLKDKGYNDEAKELLSQASQSVNIRNHNSQLQVLYAGIAYANLHLSEHNLNKEKNFEEAKTNLKEAKTYLSKIKLIDDNFLKEGLQVEILRLKTEGILYKQNKENKKAIEVYQKAFDTLNNLKTKVKEKDNAVISPLFNPNIEPKLLSKEIVVSLHLEFMELLQTKDKTYLSVFESFKQHLYDELDNLLVNKNWREANEKTYYLMSYIAEGKYEEVSNLHISNINKISCHDLKEINKKWLKNSDNIFGFSLQKEIFWEEIKKEGLDLTTLITQDFKKIQDLRLLQNDFNDRDKLLMNRLEKAYERFATRIGWRVERGVEGDYTELEWSYNAPQITKNKGYVSHLPSVHSDGVFDFGGEGTILVGAVPFFSRVTICKL
ncbi:AAA-like domain-containing protein [Scytonema sp. NUACC26]|uniref:AAA-like domain-containing protein n=1 Tax=Scytonema sp. NUACC26 TaxID=3140176 RepID=UPI0034DC3B87